LVETIASKIFYEPKLFITSSLRFLSESDISSKLLIPSVFLGTFWWHEDVRRSGSVGSCLLAVYGLVPFLADLYDLDPFGYPVWFSINHRISGVFRMCERRGPRGSGVGSPPVGSRGKAPVPQKLALFCYWMPKFWCFRRKKL